MATQRAHYEPFAWWLTRERIGHELHERYPVLQELPPRLLTLVRKLGPVDSNQSPQEKPPNWIRKLTLQLLRREADELLRIKRSP